MPNLSMPEARRLQQHAEREIQLPAPLHDYQWEGVTFLHNSISALLADEMGLGKTVQTAVALALLLNGRSGINRVLIVAPASLTTNWMTEIKTWAPSVTAWRVQGNAQARQAFYLLPVPVLVSSYEQIRYDALDRIPAHTFDLVVLDEAQRIKNRNSATALACRLLPRTRAWALSATPLENDSDDIASILGFLNPGNETDYSHASLREKLESMMLRRLKRDVRAELPPVILQDLKLELSMAQRETYDELWANRGESIKAADGDVVTVLLGLITRLKIVCNYDTASGSSSKLDALRTIFEGAGSTARILVFSQFVETLRWVSERLELACDLLTGSMSIAERQVAIDRFKREATPRALFVSLKAGGVGLNLGEATHVVLFDRWWNPAVENQAIYRAHRFDRDDPLHVVRFLTTDSIEEHIAEILERKEYLFDEVVESAGASARHFTQQDFMAILELAHTDICVTPTMTKEKETEDGNNCRV